MIGSLLFLVAFFGSLAVLGLVVPQRWLDRIGKWVSA